MNMSSFPPGRVTDLLESKLKGAAVTCQTAFEIVPVDFVHQNNPFQAHIFVCQFTGTVNGQEYAFRKCYSRGCPHNLCPHVSQAVMIANRYLQRDYHKLDEVGIPVDKRLFSLDEMMVKFEDSHDEPGTPRTIHDIIRVAKEGQKFIVEPSLERVSAVEHFANQARQTLFLMVNFAVTDSEKISRYERCLACYPVDAEKREIQQKIAIANDRLRLLYDAFEAASITHSKRFFE
jgi:hypothetical protein